VQQAQILDAGDLLHERSPTLLAIMIFDGHLEP
jgi:hypothetical protein